MAVYLHTPQPITNQLLEYNEGQGSVYWIFQRRYLSQDLGQVFAYLRQVLERAQWPLINYTDFCLVNLYSPFYRTSHGACPPPPEEVLVPTTRLALTFSLKGKRYSRVKKLYKIRYNDWSYMWGDGILNSHDYFTIDIPILEYRRFKFRAFLPLNMFHTYNVLSILTKNYVINYRRTKPLKSLTLHDYHVMCYHLHFGDFIKRRPWWMLPYNRFVWKYATNLLSTMLTPETVLYYAMYLTDQKLAKRVEGDKGTSIVYGQESITSFLTSSIERFFDLGLKKPQTIDLLFPAFLYPTQSKYYQTFLESKRQQMLSTLDGLYRKEDKQQFLTKCGLYPYNKLALNLVNGYTDDALAVFD